jgi:hypothetical protein
MSKKSGTNLHDKIRSMIDNEMRGVHTVSLCVVEEVDRDAQRVTVSLKEDEEVFVGDIPIASQHARQGEGMVTPLAVDDEGLLLHSREPLYNKTQERGHKPTEVSRHHTMKDAVFLPMFWFDEDELPPHEEGQFRIYLMDDHPTGDPKPSIDFRLDPQNNEAEIVLMDEGEPVTSIFLSLEGGGTEITSLDGGTPMSDLIVQNDGSVIVRNVDAGKTWQMGANGKVTINGSEVVTEDGKVQDTFLGLGDGIDSSGQ